MSNVYWETSKAVVRKKYPESKVKIVSILYAVFNGNEMLSRLTDTPEAAWVNAANIMRINE